MNGRRGGRVRGPVDVRLGLAAGVAWLVLALSLRASPTVLVIEAAAAVLLGIAGLCLGRSGAARVGRAGRAARVGSVVAAGGFCVALVLVPFAGRLWQAHNGPLQRLARDHTDATVEFTVSGDPQLVAGTGVSGPERVALDAQARTVATDAGRWSVSGSLFVLAPAKDWTDVLPGQRIRVEGSLEPSRDAGSDGAALFAEQAPQLLGHPPWYQRAAGVVRVDLQRSAAVLPDDERGLLPGLVDGDTSTLDPVLYDRFRTAGLTHLVAVSGSNCSILLGVVLLVLRRARARPLVCAAVGALVLVGFVVVARPSPSVLRAALMAGIALVSMATGRPRQAVPALGATVLVLLVWQPQLAVDASFSMSALATGALLLVAPGWAASLRRWHVPPVLAESLAVAASAHLVTMPVIAALSGQVSVVAIPANVLAEPVVAVATVLGFAAAAVGPAWAGGGRGLAWLAGWPCRWLVAVAQRLGGLHGATVGWPGGSAGALGLLAGTLVLLILCRRRAFWRATAAAALVVLFVRIPVSTLATSWPPPGWLMVVCDVGQGDAIVLSAGPHTAVEVDAGPDPVPIDRCLNDLGITRIQLLVFSHYHLDHVGGLAGVLHDRTVDRVITGPLAEPASGVELVDKLLAPRGLTVTVPPVGASFDVGQVHLDVLAPSAPFHDTHSDPNNSSLVLRATIDGVRILLPGDAEIEAQQAMLAAGVDVRADVLKVPHHGSAYSDPRFLASVGARVAVISVGLHNDYGHPAPSLLADLAQLGLPVRRTDSDGDVAIVGPLAHLAVISRGVAASSS